MTKSRIPHLFTCPEDLQMVLNMADPAILGTAGKDALLWLIVHEHQIKEMKQQMAEMAEEIVKLSRNEPHKTTAPHEANESRTDVFCEVSELLDLKMSVQELKRSNEEMARTLHSLTSAPAVEESRLDRVKVDVSNMAGDVLLLETFQLKLPPAILTTEDLRKKLDCNHFDRLVRGSEVVGSKIMVENGCPEVSLTLLKGINIFAGLEEDEVNRILGKCETDPDDDTNYPGHLKGSLFVARGFEYDEDNTYLFDNPYNGFELVLLCPDGRILAKYYSWEEDEEEIAIIAEGRLSEEDRDTGVLQLHWDARAMKRQNARERYDSDSDDDLYEWRRPRWKRIEDFPDDFPTARFARGISDSPCTLYPFLKDAKTF